MAGVSNTVQQETPNTFESCLFFACTVDPNVFCVPEVKQKMQSLDLRHRLQNFCFPPTCNLSSEDTPKKVDKIDFALSSYPKTSIQDWL